MANFYNGASASSVFLALLVIGAELIPPLKSTLAAIFNHHWVGKLILVLGAFILSSLVWKNETVFGIGSDRAAWHSVLLSMAAMLLFYILHYLA